MNELTGGLIQMTAHMELTAAARGWITWGIAVAALFAFLAVCAALSRHREHKARYALAFAAFALAGICMAVGGARLPRVKILWCCASGPVSLEQVAARYDILEVDGKLLVLAER